MKLSQLTLSYGFVGLLMLGTMPWLVRIATYSAEALRVGDCEGSR